MITHILYKLLDKFNVANGGFRKVLAVFIALMIFGLIFAVVKFTRMEIPNFNRNLAMLLGVDLFGFFFVVWKEKNYQKEVIKENIPIEVPVVKEEPKNEIILEKNIEIIPEKVEEIKEDDGDNLEKIMNEIIEENNEKESQSEIS